jgi:hypothetical protein
MNIFGIIIGIILLLISIIILSISSTKKDEEKKKLENAGWSIFSIGICSLIISIFI